MTVWAGCFSKRNAFCPTPLQLPGSHAIGATGVSWAPSTPAGSLVTGKAGGGGAGAPLVKRLVSCGCDNSVRVWRCSDGTGLWEQEEVLGGHADWVRDCAWAPHLGLLRATIASAGQDGQVRGAAHTCAYCNTDVQSLIGLTVR